MDGCETTTCMSCWHRIRVCTRAVGGLPGGSGFGRGSQVAFSRWRHHTARRRVCEGGPMRQLCDDMPTGSPQPLLLAMAGRFRSGGGGAGGDRWQGDGQLHVCMRWRRIGDIDTCPMTPSWIRRRGDLAFRERSGDPSQDAKGCGGRRVGFGAAIRTHGCGANRCERCHILRAPSSPPEAGGVPASPQPSRQRTCRAREPPDTAACGCRSAPRLTSGRLSGNTPRSLRAVGSVILLPTASGRVHTSRIRGDWCG